jgi:ATP-binding cassette subfamily F protein uup
LGNGKVSEHTGNYSDYIESIKENEEKTEKIKIKKQVADRNSNREKTLKFTFKEQREYDQIDNLIEDTENALAKIDDKINNCSSEYTKLQELLAEKKSIEEKLEYLMQRWVYLNELAEKINNKS